MLFDDFASPGDIIGLTDGYAKIGSTRWPVSAVTSVDALRILVSGVEINKRRLRKTRGGSVRRPYPLLT